MGYLLISETKPKAKKEHQCIWCGEAILTGEKYICEISLYYGDFQHHRWHLECQNHFHVNMKKYGDGSGEFSPCENRRPKERLGFAEAISK